MVGGGGVLSHSLEVWGQMNVNVGLKTEESKLAGGKKEEKGAEGRATGKGGGGGEGGGGGGERDP